LQTAHALMDHIEQVVRGILPDADVTVHPEPVFEADARPPLQAERPDLPGSSPG
jgi:divalent metal cation (Fe/Co/Zn/Cd) transporter